jgi:hypothetical protein
VEAPQASFAPRYAKACSTALVALKRLRAFLAQHKKSIPANLWSPANKKRAAISESQPFEIIRENL